MVNENLSSYSWIDKVTNEDVRQNTGQELLELDVGRRLLV